MKAYYKTVLWGAEFSVYEYVLLEMTEPCCDEMRQAIENGAIHFGEIDRILNRDCNINLHHHSHDEYAIRFCPFCGEKVEIQERERVILKKYHKEVPTHTEVEYKEEPLPLQGS